MLPHIRIVFQGLLKTHQLANVTIAKEIHAVIRKAGKHADKINLTVTLAFVPFRHQTNSKRAVTQQILYTNTDKICTLTRIAV